MKQYEDISIPATTRKCLEKVICDLCGKESKRTDWWRRTWDESEYDFQETELNCRIGEDYPEGRNYDEYEIDMCPDCFINRLIPWIEKENPQAKIEKQEVYN